MQYVACSRRRALLLGGVALASAFLVALIAAFARPVLRCPIVRTPSGTRHPAPTLEAVQSYRWNSIRLPNFVVPLHYDLLLHLNLSDATTRGSVNVSLHVSQPSDFLVLHAKNLSVTRVQLWGAPVAVLRWQELTSNDQLLVELDHTLGLGRNVTLGLDFEGTLHRDLVGLYLSSYTTTANETRLLVATQFEPTSARRAFPCMDEPALKATFALTLWNDKAYMAYANTRPESSRLEGMLRVTQFERTLRMSTYLVAFVVCDYKSHPQQVDSLQVGLVCCRTVK